MVLFLFCDYVLCEAILFFTLRYNIIFYIMYCYKIVILRLIYDKKSQKYDAGK